MSADRNGWKIVFSGVLMGLVAAASATGQVRPSQSDQSLAEAAAVDARMASGMTRQVRLPDGALLVLGADGATLTLRETQRSRIVLTKSLPSPRIDASVTLLPGGRVLIWGGTDSKGKLQSDGMWFDPGLHTLEPAEGLSLSARSAHSATVLTDGSVLFAGGRSDGPSAEIWNERTNRILHVPDSALSHRSAHQARLQSDGRVRLVGGAAASHIARTDAWFDSVPGRFTASQSKAEDLTVLGLAGSLPATGASNVLPDAQLSVRFTQPVRMADLNTSSVTLLGPGGATALKVMPVEDGRLVFATPAQDLFPDSKYTLLIDGVHAASGRPLPLIAIDFKTAALGIQETEQRVEQRGVDELAPLFGTEVATGSGTSQAACGQNKRKLPCHAAGRLQEGIWTPGRDNTDNRWRVRGSQPALIRTDIMARITEAVGFTTLIGRIARVDGVAVANVDVSIGSRTARTDAAGHFTIYNAPTGHQEIYVDGTTANGPGVEYGQFVVGADIKAGQLTQLPYTMYLPRIATRDKIKIPSPLARDVVLTHPDMPGLQVQIPAGTVIRDRKGRLVRELAIVPTPVNRAPFPVADNYPMYFTLEPGGAVVQGLTPKAANGIRVFYPNYDEHPKGTQANFWIYDPTEGWRVYGKGRVTSDGTRFAPEAGVALHETMGGSYSVSTDEEATERDKPPCNEACGSAQGGGGASAGDPIDLKTGEFFYSETDIAITDIIPLTLSRDYRPHDLKKREFGFGTAANFNYKLYAPSDGTYDTIELVLPSGVPIIFQRTGGSGLNGEWRQAGSTTAYNGAQLKFVNDASGHGFRLTMRDGSRLQFGNYAPNPLQWIEDRFGNRTEFVYDAGLVSNIVSPSGRWLSFDYDSENRIEAVKDHTGRAWAYDYNSYGLLDNVIYPDQTYRHYEYRVQSDGISLIQHRVEAIFNQRGHRILLNEFEPVGLGWSGRVVKQTLADGSVYTVDYAHVDGATTGVLVTHPDGSKRRIVFDINTPYPKTDTVGYGTSIAQTVEFERDVYGRITAKIDALGRRTEFQYDAEGQTTQITVLADTTEAKSMQMSYTADGELFAITDPLNQITTLGYTDRCLTSVTNPLSQATTRSCNGAGLPISVTDPVGNTTSIQYQDYQVSSISDPLGRSMSIRYDALGQLTATQDAEGNLTRREYDVLGRVKKTYDANGNSTEYGYDNNGNLLAVLLPNGSGITYTYNNRDQQISRTDSLGQVEHWTYDGMGRIDTYTDRKGQVTDLDYDVLGRSTATIYEDGRNVIASYDAANRLLSLVDSISGTLTWAYDDFDQIIVASSPQGSIGYEYDEIGRRTGMTAASQPKVEYQYDPAGRVLRILQGSDIVDFDYDEAGRLVLTTLPNDVKAGYAYNAASQLTGIAWTKPDDTLIGDLGYGYNNAGRQIVQTGSFSPQALPPSSNANSFDDNSRQVLYESEALTYDANGNITFDGSRTYIWDARDRLVEIKQGASTIATFGYDALGRRYFKVESGQAVTYLHDAMDPVQESSAGQVKAILTGRGIDDRFSRGAASARVYYLTDAIGSTKALTDASGSVIQTYDYSPYGDNAPGSVDNPYQFAAREHDATGLYYYRARYYNPRMGRFLSEDPRGLSDDLNPYAYVGNNPAEFTDPYGTSKGAKHGNPSQPTAPPYPMKTYNVLLPPIDIKRRRAGPPDDPVPQPSTASGLNSYEATCQWLSTTGADLCGPGPRSYAQRCTDWSCMRPEPIVLCTYNNPSGSSWQSRQGPMMHAPGYSILADPRCTCTRYEFYEKY